MEEKQLSTTALAKVLGKEPKGLFVLLSNGGWMIKVDGHWRLTEKGKFEGGVYIDHPKYGEYVAWPESIKTHSFLSMLPEAPLSATDLSKKLSVPARLINLILAERAWIVRSTRGWRVTDLGAALGGQQKESEKTGIPFVTWPESLVDNLHLQAAAAALRGDATRNGGAEEYRTLDGHQSPRRAEAMIDNWLYITGLTHSCCRRLPISEEVYANFYLPEAHVYIEFWGSLNGPDELKEKLRKQELYQQYHLHLIELEESDLANLDEVLPRLLLPYGLAVY